MARDSGGGLYQALSRYRKVRGLDRHRMERKPGRVVRQDQVRKELSGRLPAKHRLRDYVADYRIPQRPGTPQQPEFAIPERPGMGDSRLVDRGAPSGQLRRASGRPPDLHKMAGNRTSGRASFRKEASELDMLGQSGINRVEGSARQNRQFQVAYDDQADRFVHVYGQGPNARQVYLDQDNPYSDMYEQEFGRSPLGEMLTGRKGRRRGSGGARYSGA